MSEHHWSRTEKIGIASLFVAIISAGAAVAVVPGVRDWFTSSPLPGRTGPLAHILSSAGGEVTIQETGLRQLCQRRLTVTDLAGLNQHQLELLRNGIFAIHGRPFQRRDLREFFSRQHWYYADPAYEDGRLTAIDMYNVNVILKAERSAR